MDIILFNGKVKTMDINNPDATAVGIVGNTIKKVACDQDVLSLKNETTKLIDMEGSLILPGFNDSHLHLAKSVSKGRSVGLTGVKSVDEIIQRGRQYIEDYKIEDGKWVVGRGWNQDFFEGSKDFPTRLDLDKISTRHPIAFLRTCGHIVIGNSLALEIAGFNKDTEQIDGGSFDLDQEGNPTGVLRERAMDIFLDNVPEESVEDKKKGILTAIEVLHQEGITSVQSDDFTQTRLHYKKVIEAYDSLRAEGKLKVRVYQQCLLQDMFELTEFLDSGYKTGQGDNYYKIGPLKLLGDGALGARTALLSQAYADDPTTRGIPIFSQEELDQLVLTAHNNGMNIAVHAIGDGTIDMTLDSIEKALKENPKKDHRHSLVHCQITRKDNIKRFKELGVLAHLQPVFIDYDWKIVEDRVGEDLARTSYNWRAFIDEGVHIALGSDAPVEPFGGIRGIYHAVTMKDLDGNPESGWQIEKALSVEEAVYAYTMGGAYASFEEDIKGSIEEGKLADIIVLSDNIFEIEKDAIKNVKVDMTIFDGEIVYKR